MQNFDGFTFKMAIAALTLFVSRKFGFTFLFLPLFFAWGGDRRGGS